jgi:hypothetical protein
MSTSDMPGQESVFELAEKLANKRREMENKELQEIARKTQMAQALFTGTKELLEELEGKVIHCRKINVEFSDTDLLAKVYLGDELIFHLIKRTEILCSDGFIRDVPCVNVVGKVNSQPFSERVDCAYRDVKHIKECLAEVLATWM